MEHLIKQTDKAINQGDSRPPYHTSGIVYAFQTCWKEDVSTGWGCGCICLFFSNHTEATERDSEPLSSVYSGSLYLILL